MKRILLAGLMGVLALGIYAQRRGIGRSGPVEKAPLAKSDGEKRILDILDRARSGGEVYLEVPPGDGRMLRLQAEAIGAKNVVEIGTSTGYSGLWICMALRSTGGRLTTFEFDHGRAALAARHFRDAGVESLVTIVEGDAHRTVARLKDPIDMLFIDADKEGYTDYLEKLLPLVRPGGLILAHNIDMVAGYVDAVTGNANLETIFYMQGGGLGITLKKR